MMAFWLAVHKENMEVAQHLINYEPSLRYISILAFKGKNERPPPPKPREKKKDPKVNSDTHSHHEKKKEMNSDIKIEGSLD